jgi:predicted anti-sigma-YlaC factor YlaD
MRVKKNIIMTCQHATSVVEKKRDGQLSLTERIGLWIHLGYCSICRLFFQQADIIDKSFEVYADNIDIEQKVYPLDPARKNAMDRALKGELKK